MKTPLHLAILALICAITVTRSPAATISWSGAGGDFLWSNPVNWTGGTLPTADDSVVINVPGTVTVHMDLPGTTVRSLQCQESFVIADGPFTVTNGASVVNGSFSMGANQTLAAVGFGTTFTANGLTTNVSWLAATGGAIIDLPNARDVTARWAYPSSVGWSADGAGSAIRCVNLTNVLVEQGAPLGISATDGGQIELPALRHTEGWVQCSASGSNSVVNLSGRSGLWAGLSGIWFGQYYADRVSADNGGAVLIPNVTALNEVDLSITGNATILTSQLRSITGCNITVASRTNGFEGLTNFSGSISASDSHLDLTNLTVLHVTNGASGFQASQNSVINLSRVTNVAGPYYGVASGAEAGSRIDFSGLRSSETPMTITATDGGSVVDLSGLTGEWDGNNSTVRAVSGGSVLFASVTAMRRINLDLGHDAVVTTPQIRSFVDGTITLTGRTNGFEGLTNFNASVSLDLGSRLDLTNIYNKVLDATIGSLSFSADHGSVIDLSQITNVVSPAANGLSASAANGSRIDLRRLRAAEGPVSATAQGADSLIDLSGLTGLWSGGDISASLGATILMPNVTALHAVNVTVRDTASVNLQQLTSYTAVSGTGSLILYNRTNDLVGLTQFSGNLVAYDSRMELTNLTTLYATNVSAWFHADAGSVIDLSQVTNVVVSWPAEFHLVAYNGGRIDVHRLPAQDDGPIAIDARYAGSFIDLSGFSGSWDGSGSVTAWDGATIAISNVTAMRGIFLNLRGDANVPTAQLTSHTDGGLTVVSRTNVFSVLTNLSGTVNNFAVRAYDSHLAFPRLTQLHGSNYNLFRAETGALIDLSQVTNSIVGANYLYLYAFGGRIDLPGVESVAGSHVDVRADGSGAVVDLRGLTSFFSDNNEGKLFASSGGTILLNTNAMLLAGVAVNLDGNPGGPLPPFLAASQSLVLYGQPWQSYRVESRDPSVAGSPWSLYARVPLTSPFEELGPRPPADALLRVNPIVADPPEVGIRRAASGEVELIVFGIPGRTYRLESRTDAATGVWENGPVHTMTNSFVIFPATGATNTARFHRAREL